MRHDQSASNGTHPTNVMRKLVAVLASIHAPPAWVWILALFGLTFAVAYYSEITLG